MDTTRPSAQASDQQFKWIPAPGLHVMVRCRGFRCLAYRDTDGKWKSSQSNDILPEVLEVLSEP